MALYFREAIANGDRLAVMLHGRGSDEEDLLPLAYVFGEATRVISVRAPFSMYPGYAWYGTEEGALQESIAELSHLIDQEAGSRPVLLLGFSQGGLMACATAIERQARHIAGVVSLSAPPLAADVSGQPLNGLPVFWGHGRQDPVVPWGHGQQMREILEKLGAQVQAQDYPIGHTISPEELEAVSQWLAHTVS